MKLRLLCVGRPRERRFAELHDDYAERLRRLGVDYTSGHVDDVAVGGRYSDDHVREREARALEKALEKQRTRWIALDPAGELLTSEALASRIEGWSAPSATFVIGGPLGIAPDLVERATFRWALSRSTFPHEMVRVLVAEQLYRAVTIRRRIPYHR